MNTAKTQQQKNFLKKLLTTLCKYAILVTLKQFSKQHYNNKGDKTMKKYILFAFYGEDHHIEGHYVTTLEGATAISYHALTVDKRITELVITSGETGEVLRTLVRN